MIQNTAEMLRKINYASDDTFQNMHPSVLRFLAYFPELLKIHIPEHNRVDYCFGSFDDSDSIELIYSELTNYLDHAFDSLNQYFETALADIPFLGADIKGLSESANYFVSMLNIYNRFREITEDINQNNFSETLAEIKSMNDAYKIYRQKNLNFQKVFQELYNYVH